MSVTIIQGTNDKPAASKALSRFFAKDIIGNKNQPD